MHGRAPSLHRHYPASLLLRAPPTPDHALTDLLVSVGRLGSTHTAGSPRFLDASVRARPPQPPRQGRRVLSVVASPPISGFTISGWLALPHQASRGRIGFAFARAHAFAVKGCSPSRLLLLQEVTGTLLMVGCPSTRDRRYMVNDQLPWLTPFSQQDAPDFAWRTRGRRDEDRWINPRYHRRHFRVQLPLIEVIRSSDRPLRSLRPLR